MQQFLVPTLKNCMKYYRNYDGSKKGTKAEEGTHAEAEGQPVKKRKIFKQQQHLKAVAFPFLPPAEDKASRAWHV